MKKLNIDEEARNWGNVTSQSRTPIDDVQLIMILCIWQRRRVSLKLIHFQVRLHRMLLMSILTGRNVSSIEELAVERWVGRETGGKHVESNIIAMCVRNACVLWLKFTQSVKTLANKIGSLSKSWEPIKGPYCILLPHSHSHKCLTNNIVVGPIMHMYIQTVSLMDIHWVWTTQWLQQFESHSPPTDKFNVKIKFGIEAADDKLKMIRRSKNPAVSYHIFAR